MLVEEIKDEEAKCFWVDKGKDVREWYKPILLTKNDPNAPLGIFTG